ncbi:TAXI family TRAP transporter solute-binding subunit [Rhodoligotrophos defluvii]|uniref:TAXI family TRAP transporter solute-binding subunit n=1 Tax=Rhodoligotrophos defluvii TaxID=2561934 RepID=UPI00148563D7|nr:TAXI family TRAP transporter solute-binding subunit [Rhodoligotrophos defluvii]
MRRGMRQLVGCAVAVGLFAIGLGAKAQQAPVNWTLASFVQGSSWYVYGVNLGELLRAALPEGSTVDTPPIAGGTGNPPLVAAGKADLALGIATVSGWAMEGKHAYEKPFPNLRGLIGGLDEYFLLPVAKGNRPADLDTFLKETPKARIVLLQKGSLGSLGGQQLLEIAGAGEKALADAGGSYEFGSFDMVKTRFAGGSADVFVQVVTVGHPAITEMGQSQQLTYLQPSDETLEKMREQFGWGVAVLPAGTFPGQEKDLKLPSSTTMLFTTAEFPADHAYFVVKTICEQTEKLRAAHEALRGFDCEKDKVWRQEVIGIPLHEGAERYYRERGWIQ